MKDKIKILMRFDKRRILESTLLQKKALLALSFLFLLTASAVVAIQKTSAYSQDPAISFEIADYGLRQFVGKFQDAKKTAKIGSLGSCTRGIFYEDYFTAGKYEVSFFDAQSSVLGCDKKLSSVAFIRSTSFYHGFSSVVQRWVCDSGYVWNGSTCVKDTDSSSPPLRDVVYKGSLKLDIYPAAGGRANAPVLLFLHGGGWFKGDKTDDAARFGENLSAQGVTVVAPNYTLVPGGYYPDPILDTDCALRWIAANAPLYGFDVTKVSLGGYSAGGHISLLYSLRSSVYHDGACPWDVATPSLKNVVSLAGPTNLDTITGDVRGMALDFLDGVSPVEASPFTYAGNENASAYLLLQAKDDELVPFSEQAIPFYDALLAWNPPRVQAKWYDTGGHSFAYYSDTPVYRDVIQTVRAFLSP